uniref:Uncharacterized protein n=1 Tax=Bartonella rochalimae ATCC BAA-1498 TaxID=685782 RepID=E6YMR4_9HYPH|nr:hypothetical protein BARRO_80016 [Bartonella rochalimae ATCC BAA-1498]
MSSNDIYILRALISDTLNIANECLIIILLNYITEKPLISFLFMLKKNIYIFLFSLSHL